jgi:hypothetical protein
MGSTLNINLVDALILALAVYRLCRLVIEDDVTERLRNIVWKKWDASQGVGYLITCYWCTGFWVSSLVVTSYIIVPVPTVAISLVLALSAFAGLVAAWMDK